MKPLGTAPMLREEAIMKAKIPMKVAFLSNGALAPIYPRPGPNSAERTNPTKKRMTKRARTFGVEIMDSVARAAAKVPTLKGSFIPTLSAIHPQALSPIAIPAMTVENIKPNTAGVTPIEVRYRGRMGPIILAASTPSPRIVITITN